MLVTRSWLWASWAGWWAWSTTTSSAPSSSYIGSSLLFSLPGNFMRKKLQIFTLFEPVYVVFCLFVKYYLITVTLNVTETPYCDKYSIKTTVICLYMYISGTEESDTDKDTATWHEFVSTVANPNLINLDIFSHGSTEENSSAAHKLPEMIF